ncbi:hypothetical protein ANTHELSMS3_01958 [Antarctobacter heliothermus]|uniref:Uncharacterized protein n=1 Tax=Antarctobacter heliothermus TaxID=74033 RepID=A0A222E3A1_9RHOB|nr:hypothetical protein ANTHELSMS3_01958 [Antarctobacter heliothermus]
MRLTAGQSGIPDLVHSKENKAFGYGIYATV